MIDISWLRNLHRNCSEANCGIFCLWESCCSRKGLEQSLLSCATFPALWLGPPLDVPSPFVNQLFLSSVWRNFHCNASVFSPEYLMSFDTSSFGLDNCTEIYNCLLQSIHVLLLISPQKSQLNLQQWPLYHFHSLFPSIFVNIHTLFPRSCPFDCKLFSWMCCDPDSETR